MPQANLSRDEHSIVRTRGLFVAACFVFISLGVVAAWFISADATSSIAGIEPYVRFMLSPWMLVTHIVALSFIAFGLWFLGTASLKPSVVSDFDVALRRCSRLLTLVLFLFSSALLTVGYLFADDLHATFRSQRLSEEQGIARLKAQQIDKWLLDRAFDARKLAQSLRGLSAERLAQDQESRQLVRVLFGESLAGNADRIGVALVAPDGRILTAVGEAIPEDTLRGKVAMPSGDNGLAIVDLHPRGASTSALAMEFVAPVFSADGNKPAVAAVVLAADPSRDLFRQVAQWPVASPGSEVVVVRRDGDNAQLLSEPLLLGRIPPALTFHLPLARGDLPGTQALRKGDGAREGLDYRGKKVFSASAHVTGVPWQVVAKTDADEAMASWRQKTRIVAAVIAATIVSAAFIVFILWSGQRNAYRAYRSARDEERAAMARNFEALARLARDPVFLVDPDGRICEANEAAQRAYGYDETEFGQLAMTDLVAPGAQPHASGDLVETVHRRKDGTAFPAEISSRSIDVDGRRYRQSFVRDVSQRQKLEGDLQRIARVQRALRAANSILLRATSETSLLEGMCDVIVHMGGYWMAFVGTPHHDSAKTVGFAAISGVDADRIRASGIGWDDGPAGWGPTGMALKTGEIQVQQDFANAPSTVPWRDVNLAASYGSGISLPLRVANAMIGTLTIYAAEANAFDEEEVDLLTEFVDDLSYGIGALRARAGVDMAQGALRAAD
jgi:PAS domain S-box-containing protein